MVKKRLAALAAAIVFCAVLAGTASAARIEQVQAVMPELDVYLYSVDSDLAGVAAGDVTATMDGERLEVAALGPAEGLSGGTYYIYLLDVSASLSSGYFEAAKQAVADSYDRLGAGDRLALVTFGDEVNTPLRGGESRSELEAALEPLRAADQNTAFYDGVSRAMELASEKRGMRSVGVVISDGVDDTRTGMVRSELEDRLQAEGLPLYGMCADNASGVVTDDFGSFVRASGGELYLFNSYTASETMRELHEALGKCLLLRLRAATNQADGARHELSLKFGGGAVITTTVTTADWTPDAQAPTVAALEYDPDAGMVRVTFSEPVRNGDAAGNYDLVNAEGERVLLAAARYADAERARVELIPETPPYEGVYTLTIAGVTDVSMEKNPLEGAPREIELKTGVFPEDDNPLTSLPWYAYAIAGVVLLAVIVLLVLLLRRKKRAERDEIVLETVTEEYKRHIVNGGGLKLRVEIRDGLGTVTRTTLTLNSSLILGRSDTCDVYFDDKRMSRQHCAIEYENGMLLIQDLQTTNGTFVNDVPVASRRQLQEGDVIRIGDTSISFLGIAT